MSGKTPGKTQSESQARRAAKQSAEAERTSASHIASVVEIQNAREDNQALAAAAKGSATPEQLALLTREGIGSRARGSGVFNPFVHALNLAKKVEGSRPHEDQPELINELEVAVDMLDDKEKTSLVFKLVVPVLSEEVPVQQLFALARATHHMPVAYATSAILKAKRIAGIQVPDLVAYGLGKIVVPEDRTKRPFFVAFIGKTALEAAAAQFRAEGKYEAANALSAHLERAAMAVATNQARRDAVASDASASEATATPESEEPTEDISTADTVDPTPEA